MPAVVIKSVNNCVTTLIPKDNTNNKVEPQNDTRNQGN